MHEFIQDPLRPKGGVAAPELYARCFLTWGGLGDLIHDSEGQNNLVVFQVLHEQNRHTKQGMNILLASFSTRVALASWTHSTKHPVGEGHYYHHERRFALHLESEHRQGVHSFSSQVELLVGQDASVCTERIETAEGMYYQQQKGVPEDIAAVVDMLLLRAPDSHTVEQAKAEKRSELTRSHDLARSFHYRSAEDFDSIKTEVAAARRVSDRANNLRLVRLPEVNLHRLYWSRIADIARTMIGGKPLDKA